MLKVKNYKFWFCAGSQDLYGDAVLENVAAHTKEMVAHLNESGKLPYEIVWKPTLLTNEHIRRTFNEANMDEECARYEAVVKALGGQDLQLLGMGHNGHIGFNEPADEFVKETHCVDLQESTIQANKRFFEKVEDVPTQAYTMGIGTIMQAKKILVVASGADKAEIVKKAFFGPITPQVPASILQLHPDVTVVVDEAAGSLI